MLCGSILALLPFCQAIGQDNGNHFSLSWSADLDTFFGGQGKGLQAYAGFDLDKDGLQEFVVFDKFQGFGAYDAAKVFEAVGDNDFQLVWEQRYDRFSDDEGHGLTVADLDEDGNQELLVAAENAIYIYEWDGTTFESGGGLPQEPTTTFFPIADNAGNALVRQLVVADLDGDSYKELFMGYWGEQGMYCAISSLPNKDLLDPQWKDEFADNWEYRVGGICIADFDADGNMDIWTSHFDSEGATRIYESDGPDTYVIKFTTTPGDLIMQPSFDSTIANAIFNDFDGDGAGELLICDSHGKLFVITKNSSENFTNFGPTAWHFILQTPGPTERGFVRSGFMGDLDRDGKPDIYYNDWTAPGILDIEYQGGPVTDAGSWIVYIIYQDHPIIYGYIQPAVDLDGDGKGEIVIAGNGDPQANLQIIENQDIPAVVKRHENRVADSYNLFQNYPNPFNPATTIEYTLSHSGPVQLLIFNARGRTVKNLVSATQTSGLHREIWDGRDDNGNQVPAGVYLSQLTAQNSTRTIKLVLVK